MHGSSDDALAAALLELMGFINDPRQDWRMMAEAGLDLDPVFLPLLVRLGAWGPTGVVELADRIGRDHSTLSRQLARLEAAGLVQRATSQADGRIRAAQVTPRGAEAVADLSAARRRLFDRALAAWTSDDRDTLARLLRRFAEALRQSTREPRKDGDG
ncbi:MAG TPA: MarR family transcriptional regulator [Caulobacteraceae bacterium]|jgi:DNA-binding MarR family transcriptional regulator|nr:MarR family transcriptional regulator [Caulobacteraceae bacterium]